jgi:excisionase family DNA binding protein
MSDPARTRANEVRLAVALGADEIERIAERAAEIVEARASKSDADRPYLSVRECADYLRCSRQRVYDLLSQGSLSRLKDGTRVLVARAEIDAYLRGEPTGRLARRHRGRRDAPKAPRERGPAEPRLFAADPLAPSGQRRSSSPPASKRATGES